MSLHLENLAHQEMVFDAERLKPVQALFYRPLQGLDSLRVYTARAKAVEGEEAMDFRIGLLPLRGDFAGANYSAHLSDVILEESCLSQARCLVLARSFHDDIFVVAFT